MEIIDISPDFQSKQAKKNKKVNYLHWGEKYGTIVRIAQNYG
jgi:hypothetical protein